MTPRLFPSRQPPGLAQGMQGAAGCKSGTSPRTDPVVYYKLLGGLESGDQNLTVRESSLARSEASGSSKGSAPAPLHPLQPQA